VGLKELLRRLIRSGWDNRLVPRVLVFMGIGGIATITFWVLYYNLRTQTLRWQAMRTMKFDNAQLEQWCVVANPGKEGLCTRLAEQASLAQLRADFHFDLFSYYTSLHFASVSVAFWASIFAAACLAYLVKHGWEHANHWMSTAFVAFSITLAFYRGYPLLAKHEENLKDNHLLFLEHQNLVQKIRSFCATGHAHDDIEDLVTFVMLVDEELVAKNRIPLEFDASQIDVASSVFLESQGVSPSGQENGQ
jgi:hypothetical protein